MYYVASCSFNKYRKSTPSEASWTLISTYSERDSLSSYESYHYKPFALMHYSRFVISVFLTQPLFFYQNKFTRKQQSSFSSIKHIGPIHIAQSHCLIHTTTSFYCVPLLLSWDHMNICLQQTDLISLQIQICIKTKHKGNRSIFNWIALGTLHDFHYVYCLILQISGHVGSVLNLSEKHQN